MWVNGCTGCSHGLSNSCKHARDCSAELYSSSRLALRLRATGKLACWCLWLPCSCGEGAAAEALGWCQCTTTAARQEGPGVDEDRGRELGTLRWGSRVEGTDAASVPLTLLINEIGSMEAMEQVELLDGTSNSSWECPCQPGAIGMGMVGPHGGPMSH